MVRKVDSILDSMEKAQGLSKDGRNWLTLAIDPFHDEDIRCSGYPDLTTGSSVVQLIKKQLQITVPASVPDGSNWDSHVQMWPFIDNFDINGSVVVNGNGLVNPGAYSNVTSYQIGGLNVVSAPSGSNTFYGPGATLPAGLEYQHLSCPEYMNGSCRVISMGFEVVNTTADLQKQGQVTVYRVPNSFTETTIISQQNLLSVAEPTGVTVDLAADFTGTRLPPSNIAQANLLFGSRTWDAREGAYVVCRQNSLDNPFQQPAYRLIAALPVDLNANLPNNIHTIGAFNFPDGREWPGTTTQDLYAPFDISGAYFTGLSYTTTLTVTARWYIERLPGPNQPDLVVLATPASIYDPLALECYAHAMSSAPPGVMVKENPLGEWFAKALHGVSKWAPKIGDALNTVLPGSEQISKIIGNLATRGAKSLDKRNEKQKQKKALPGSKSNLAK